MKNNLFKITKITAVVLFTFVSLIAMVLKADAAPATISMGTSSLSGNYIEGTQFGVKKTSNGGYAYCLDRHKQTPSNIVVRLVGEKDAGFAYILENGYPKKKITGNGGYDYYITQSAVWWYLDSTTGTSNLSKSFKTTGSDPKNLRPKIKKLVDGAIAAKKAGYKKPSLSLSAASNTMALSSDGKYYVSNKVVASASKITSNYKVSFTSAPAGSYITDAMGKKKTEFGTGHTFKVYVPVSSVKDLSTTVKVKVTATGAYNKAYEYKADNTKIQNIIPTVIAPVSVNVQTSINLNIQTSKVTVIKLDKKTNQALAGAKLVLKDSKGGVITSWTSTVNGHVIKNLPDGNYTVTETEAPAKYKLDTTPMSFTIKASSRDVTVKLYNEVKTNIVNILKVDKKTGEPVSGAKLVLKDSKGGVIKSWSSTTSAYVVSDLAEGNYTVEETEAPTGYKLDTTPVSFAITKDSTTVTVKLYNEAKTNIVNIIKTDKKTGETIAGAKLVLKDSKGGVIQSWTSTTSAYVLTNLAEGNYTVEETEAPTGYKLDKTPVSFTITSDSATVTVKLYNEAKTNVVNITKIDKATGNVLAGAVLKVTNSAGEEIAQFTTTNDPYVLLNLKEDTYTIQEVSAPDGYILSDEKITFTIDDAHTSHQITVKNTPEKVCIPGTGDPECPEPTPCVPGTGDPECPAIVPVPDTTSGASTIIYLLGTIVIISGIGFVYRNAKKQK